MKMKLDISGMSCEHCINHVKEALLEMENVSVLEVNLKGAVINAGDDITEDMLKEVIDDAGYDLNAVSKAD